MIGYPQCCSIYMPNISAKKGREQFYCLDKDKKHLMINLVKLLEIDQDVIVKIQLTFMRKMYGLNPHV